MVDRPFVRGRPVRSALVINQIDRFENTINSFMDKVSICKLSNISKDIISIEDATRELDRNIRSPRLDPKQVARYNGLLDKHTDAIRFLENNCKCKPI